MPYELRYTTVYTRVVSFPVEILQNSVVTFAEIVAFSVWVFFSRSLPWPLQFTELFFKVSKLLRYTVHPF